MSEAACILLVTAAEAAAADEHGDGVEQQQRQHDHDDQAPCQAERARSPERHAQTDKTHLP